MGQLYRSEDLAVPVVGGRITDGDRWAHAEVVDFEELVATCAMRRFRVVVRVLRG